MKWLENAASGTVVKRCYDSSHVSRACPRLLRTNGSRSSNQTHFHVVRKGAGANQTTCMHTFTCMNTYTHTDTYYAHYYIFSIDTAYHLYQHPHLPLHHDAHSLNHHHQSDHSSLHRRWDQCSLLPMDFALTVVAV